MCEYCDLFHHVIRTSPTKVYPACAMPNADANNLSTCPICVIYALLYQNMFAQRWNDIQTVVPTTRCAQIHASHNSLQRKECATSPHKRGLPIGSNVPTATVSTASSTHMFVNLALTENTLGTIRNILATLPATHRCTNIHIPHPVMPLTTERLVNLQGSIRSGTDEQLTLALLFHHFHLTALSELIPNDRTLELTVDNAIHLLTPPRTTSVSTPRHLHLYLNPHDRLPYLQHTYTGNDSTSYLLIVTTSILCSRSRTSNERRHPMLHTTADVPNLVTTLTFPAGSYQHQQSILTLTIHLLLTVPIIISRQSWNTLREKDSHRLTLQLILVTITLKRHHLVWSTVVNDSPAIQPTHQQPVVYISHRTKLRAMLTPQHRPPNRRHHI